MLNNITDRTEVKCVFEMNLTTFTIPVGLHPVDVKRIMDVLIEELKVSNHTKNSIDALNKEKEYLTETLNINKL